MGVGRTVSEYNSLLKADNKFVALEDYKGSTRKIKHRTLCCGYEWEVRPQQLLRPNSGCPKCGRLKPVEEVKSVLRDKNLELLSEYKGAFSIIKVKHHTCGYVWDTKYSYIQQGSGCPNCNKGFGFIQDKPEKALLYLIEIITWTGEIFLKIGVTSQTRPSLRFNSISSQIGADLLRLKPLVVVESSGKSVIALETKILSSFTKYKTNLKFDGRTELIDYSERNEIIRFIKDNINDKTVHPS